MAENDQSPWAGASLSPLAAAGQIGLQIPLDANRDAATALGLDALPSANRFATGAGIEVIWLGPAEFLVIGPATDRPELEGRLRAALGDDRGAIVDLSARRIGFELRGPAARDVLATCAPLDLHPRAFGPGSAAATLVARVPVVLYQRDAEPTYRLLVPPSFARFLVDWIEAGIRSVRGGDQA